LAETKPTEDSRFRIAFFGSDDGFKILTTNASPNEPAITGSSELFTRFQRLQFRYQNNLKGGDHIIGVAALGNDQFGFSVGSLYFIATYQSVSGRVDYGTKLGRGVTVNTGVDMLGGRYSIDMRLPPTGVPGQPSNGPFSTRNVRQITIEGPAFF